MDLLPTLSPLVVEDLKPRPTEHPEVLQERAEEALSAKVRANVCLVPGAVAVGSARLQRVQRRPRGQGLRFRTRRRAYAPRAASRHRAGAQLNAVREASKDVAPIGTRKAGEGEEDGARWPPCRAGRGCAAAPRVASASRACRRS